MKFIPKVAALNELNRERSYLIDNKMYGAEDVLTHHGYNPIDNLPSIDLPLTESGLIFHCSGGYIQVPNCDIVHNAVVYGFDDSVRAAKFPMATELGDLTVDLTDGIASLAKAEPGSGHDQWLHGVIVQFDLTFSNKAWVEAERYHFLEFVSSQSTMHRIAKFELDYAYNEYTDRRIVEIMKEKVAAYNECKDKEEKKRRYLEILYSNPAGFLLTARMTTNYCQLKTIWRQRRNHRLPEWRQFCKWIETLPHAELITEEKGKTTV